MYRAHPFSFSRAVAAMAVALTLLTAGPVMADKPAATQPPDDTAAAQSLQQKLAALQSLSARFVQTINDENGKQLQQTHGEVQLMRPNHLYWATTEPYQYKIITDGDVLWRYDVDLEQVNKQDFSAQVHATPAALLISDTSELAQRYAVTVKTTDAGEHYTLHPRHRQGNFQALTLGFKNDHIETITMVDSLAQTTIIAFSDVAMNTDIDASRFQFTPPPGVDVIANDIVP